MPERRRVPSMATDATKMLVDIRAGRRSPADLFPLVYDELCRVARQQMRKERADHTLQTTGLVHEAYMRLIRQEKAEWQDRAHFLAIAARAMREILVDHARHKKRKKRGGNREQVPLDSALAWVEESTGVDVEAFDAALTRLTEINPRAVEVIQMRALGGMTLEEVSAALNVSVSTVEREWRYGRAWLRNALAGKGE
ncbi:MAG: sigma-70 family RNA polymerase sigma factor [Phycisphaerales bacterium]|nr:sigma-70 family RNA polymerase sigma factor [Phycisphaerales bacterium]